MGQYIVHVRKVFKLIRMHKKDLEAQVLIKPHIMPRGSIELYPKPKKALKWQPK